MTLEEVILKYRKRKFKYGDSDCCLFTKDCIEATQNIKISHPKYDGSFKTLRDNFKAQNAKNINQFIEGILLDNGFIEVNEKALPNDVLLVKNKNKVLAAFQVDRFCVSVSTNGIIQIDPSSILRVFRFKGKSTCHQ
ncbi:MAG: hypothetical protein COB02_13800 [Candidatus Cloacimonadota bacterium]|nr:MAG: hypothetical protein COB02_13800 [Candidatus Cloacimonadota bacterium]